MLVSSCQLPNRYLTFLPCWKNSHHIICGNKASKHFTFSYVLYRGGRETPYWSQRNKRNPFSGASMDGMISVGMCLLPCVLSLFLPKMLIHIGWAICHYKATHIQERWLNKKLEGTLSPYKYHPWTAYPWTYYMRSNKVLIFQQIFSIDCWIVIIIFCHQNKPVFFQNEQ